MKQVVHNYKTGKLRVAEVPVPTVRSGSLLVRNRNSFISVGTEKLMIDLAQKSLLGKARERPDLVRKAMDRLDDLAPLGYSCAGDVVKVGQGVDGFREGLKKTIDWYERHREEIIDREHLLLKREDCSQKHPPSIRGLHTLHTGVRIEDHG